MDILIATGNQGKVKELKELLSKFPINLKNLKDFPNIEEVEETGKTFAENAILKAKGYALQTNMWTIADDSGLEVEELNGEPGVFSARYAGENSTDKENIHKLLTEMKNKSNRNAKFVCCIAISNEKGEILHLTEGTCKGKIDYKPKGKKGFGYDPIFIPDGFDKTFAEISEDLKNKISHRKKALDKIFEIFHLLT
jgi:XTP/dITP diphosphohydrolase